MKPELPRALADRLIRRAQTSPGGGALTGGRTPHPPAPRSCRELARAGREFCDESAAAKSVQKVPCPIWIEARRVSKKRALSSLLLSRANENFSPFT